MHTTAQERSEMLRKNLNYLVKILGKTVEGKCIEEKESSERTRSCMADLARTGNFCDLRRGLQNSFLVYSAGWEKMVTWGKENFSHSLKHLSPRTSSPFASIEKIIK